MSLHITMDLFKYTDSTPTLGNALTSLEPMYDKTATFSGQGEVSLS